MLQTLQLVTVFLHYLHGVLILRWLKLYNIKIIEIT